MFLGAALMSEGTLFAFHLKGTPLDWTLHFLLVVLVFLAAAACFGEYRWAAHALPVCVHCGPWGSMHERFAAVALYFWSAKFLVSHALNGPRITTCISPVLGQV